MLNGNSPCISAEAIPDLHSDTGLSVSRGTGLKPLSYPRSDSDPGCIPDTRMAAGLVEEIDGYLIWLSDGFLIIS